jgi:beta-alanine degradation protein BauB
MTIRARIQTVPGPNIARTGILTAAFFSISVVAAMAHDPVLTDGDKYKMRFENDRIRVLEYRDMPGAKTLEHHHPAFVVYALSSFKRAIRLPDGKVLTREFKAGDVMWSDAQTHVGENVGDTPTHIILIEMK